MASSLVASDADVVVDGSAILVVSALIVVAADELQLLTIVVPVVLVARLAIWLRNHRDRAARLTELAFYAICTLLGAFNDWSSVVRHAIYDYTVPVYLPDISSIPMWMLLYWGLVLRFFITLGTWHRVGLATPRDGVRFGGWRTQSAALKVIVLVAIVAATRQTIYRTYLDPIWSWAPFALAGLVYVSLFGVDRRELRLALVVLIVGPLVEAAYIGLGGLHVYHLGWLAGVPLWIALWWVLAVLIWCDLGQRARLALTRRFSRRRRRLAGRPRPRSRASRNRASQPSAVPIAD